MTKQIATESFEKELFDLLEETFEQVLSFGNAASSG